eukprot:4813360-Pyramimonas_sp.AAC.1
MPEEPPMFGEMYLGTDGSSPTRRCPALQALRPKNPRNALSSGTRHRASARRTARGAVAAYLCRP